MVAVLLVVYRISPLHGATVREIWPGAAVGALGLLLAKEGLGRYPERLGDLGAVYGSLGALIAMGVLAFIAANVVVFGAEFSAERTRLPEDDDEVRKRVAAGRAGVRAALPGA